MRSQKRLYYFLLRWSLVNKSDFKNTLKIGLVHIKHIALYEHISSNNGKKLSFWRNFHNRRTFTSNFIWPWCMKFARFATKSTQVLLVLFSAITWRIFMTLMFWDAKTTILPPWLQTPDWGSFFNYVDKMSPTIDHLPTLYWHWWGYSFTLMGENLLIVDIFSTTYLLTSSFQHRLWTTPCSMLMY